MFSFTLFLIVLAIIFVAKGVIIVQQAEVVIVERLGKYHKTLQSGFNFIIPVIDCPRAIDWKVTQKGFDGMTYSVIQKKTRIDLREAVYDFPRQNVITKDNASKVIDTVLEGLDKAKSVRIVSEFWEEIGDSIMKELNVSVTYIKSKGGYSKQEKILTFCVVNKFEIPKLKEVVHDIDPRAFIVTEDVHEVEGIRIKKKSH